MQTNSLDLRPPDNTKFTGVHLVLSEDLTVEQWVSFGGKLFRAEKVIRWWIGDWLVFGKRKYSRFARHLKKISNLRDSSIYNCAYVSYAIESSRRRETLSWSMHAEIAQLPPKEQDKFLDIAEEQKLSVIEVRKLVRQSQATTPLESDGPIIKFATRHVDDLMSWVKRQDEGFWTPSRKLSWMPIMAPVREFCDFLEES